uniref:Uncharacterized protein n=1 Tax=Anguilla anguilla TaxID=7936 RepID=A0A0E9QUC9_ANGAN
MAHCEIFSWGPESWRHPDCPGARGFLERRPLPTAPPAPTWFPVQVLTELKPFYFMQFSMQNFSMVGWLCGRIEDANSSVSRSDPIKQRALVCSFSPFSTHHRTHGR